MRRGRPPSQMKRYHNRQRSIAIFCVRKRTANGHHRKSTWMHACKWKGIQCKHLPHTSKMGLVTTFPSIIRNCFQLKNTRSSVCEKRCQWTTTTIIINEKALQSPLTQAALDRCFQLVEENQLSERSLLMCRCFQLKNTSYFQLKDLSSVIEVSNWRTPNW